MATGNARLKYKLVVVGDEAVGKTSILTRFMYDTFTPQYKVTVGIDFVSKNIYLEDRCIRLQLWDTAGQERFKSLIPSYIRDCSIALVVFDVSNRQSFLSTSAWVQDIRHERGSDVVLVLVGNKGDLEDQRQVSIEEAKAHSKSLNIPYIDLSAKTGHNIKQMFHQLARALPQVTAETKVEEAKPSVKLDEPTQTQEGSKRSYCGCQ